MIILRMMTGLAAGFATWLAPRATPAKAGCEAEGDRLAAEAFAAMVDANTAAEASTSRDERDAALGGCYHDGVAYSLGYDAGGVVELDGKTFTNLDTGLDGGAAAALREHRQNFDPNRDIPRFIVALKPIRVVRGRRGDEPYGLPPGPRPVELDKRATRPESTRVQSSRGRPGGGGPREDAGTGKNPPACGKCSSPYCECDGSCDEDYGTFCYRCDTWACGYCVVEGACHNCFSKMQGGVI